MTHKHYLGIVITMTTWRCCWRQPDYRFPLPTDDLPMCSKQSAEGHGWQTRQIHSYTAKPHYSLSLPSLQPPQTLFRLLVTYGKRASM